MPIVLTCEACERMTALDEGEAGKLYRCECGRRVRVPGQSRPAAAKPSPWNELTGSLGGIARTLIWLACAAWACLTALFCVGMDAPRGEAAAVCCASLLLAYVLARCAEGVVRAAFGPGKR